MRRSQLDDFGGAGQRGFRLLAIAALDIEHEIGAEPLVHERRAGRDRRARIADAGQRLIIDRDRLGGVFRRKAVFGDDRGDDVADVAHFVAGESRPRRIVHRPAVGERHRMHDGELAVAGALPVFGGERQQHAGHGSARLRRDLADARMARAGCARRRTTPFRAARRHRRTAPGRAGSAHPRAGAAVCRCSALRCRTFQCSCGRIARISRRSPSAAGSWRALRACGRNSARNARQCAGVAICRCRLSRTARFGIAGLQVRARPTTCALQAFSRNIPTQTACSMLRAAKDDAVIAEQHGEVLAERTRNGLAFALPCDQRDVAPRAAARR